jgi:hypothetical protein
MTAATAIACVFSLVHEKCRIILADHMGVIYYFIIHNGGKLFELFLSWM